ncbi:uncharacterized protein LOC125195352 [Salvia hispanica]|uniref:uncharacterized protein LOC125195352 n=1 Tax=Salvia hispanica TaxID=49212 RepID=UPI002009406F|nr:uncharacterized protein LOC125195352 [Salvia hispanica]
MATPNSVNESVIQVMSDVIRDHHFDVICVILIYLRSMKRGRRGFSTDIRRRYSFNPRIPQQVCYINRLLRVSDVACLENLRLDRNAFGRLCIMLRQTGDVVDGRYASVDEQVAMFLGILAHHKKVRVVKFEHWQSGYIVSKYVHAVLKAVLKLHRTFWVVPEPVADDHQWKWFKGCVGALDGTYINVQVPNGDKPRYRSRKGQICTNTLAACDHNMRFVYVLAGWEGSAGDARVLPDAVNRENGFRVPIGNYYLCDNGYANCEGFLTPYKSVRYHLQEWAPGTGTGAPQNPREIFNMRHTRARNVIERAFAFLKMRWGILRSASYYPMTIQTQLILACFLLHNYSRSAMPMDPLELLADEEDDDIVTEVESQNVQGNYIESVEPSNAWTHMRDNLAGSMWDETNARSSGDVVRACSVVA